MNSQFIILIIVVSFIFYYEVTVPFIKKKLDIDLTIRGMIKTLFGK